MSGWPRPLPCALVLIALGCAPADERSHLVLLTEGIPPTLDPAAADDSRVDNKAINLYSALLQYRPGATDPQMDLAASWQVSEDARRYVFDLREDALFHDGTPVLAEDVKYTVDRMLALKIGVWAYFTSVSGAEVLGERRVAIDLFQPFAGLPGALTRLYIVNADLIRPNEFQGDFGQRWLQNHEAGSGPYRMVSFQPGQQIAVERFPGYHLGWGPRHVERAVFRVLREEVARRIALVNGDADWIYISSADTLAALAGEPGVRVNRDESLNQLYIAFNTQSRHLGDARVRRALALAYDYEGHIEHLMRGNAAQTHGVLPAGAECASPDSPRPRTDLDEARRLLDSAGIRPDEVELTMAFEGTTGETPDFRDHARGRGAPRHSVERGRHRVGREARDLLPAGDIHRNGDGLDLRAGPASAPLSLCPRSLEPGRRGRQQLRVVPERGHGRVARGRRRGTRRASSLRAVPRGGGAVACGDAVRRRRDHGRAVGPA